MINNTNNSNNNSNTNNNDNNTYIIIMIIIIIVVVVIIIITTIMMMMMMIIAILITRLDPDAVLLEPGGEVAGDGVRLALRRDVDDGRAALRGDLARDAIQVGSLRLLAVAEELQVGAVEGAARGQEVLAQAELLDDVELDARDGGRRQRHEGHAGQLLADAAQGPVGRAEVVAPLRDAVGLVHGDERDAPLGVQGLEALQEGARELLGGEVHQAVLSPEGRLLHVRVGLRGAEEAGAAGALLTNEVGTPDPN